MPIASKVYLITGIMLIVLGYIVYKENARRLKNKRKREYILCYEELGEILGKWAASIGVFFLIGSSVGLLVYDKDTPVDGIIIVFIYFFFSLFYIVGKMKKYMDSQNN